MKKECAVVQDLLVLYEDNVLKEESRQMVEEHIRSCGECMRLYETVRTPLPSVEKVPEPSGEEQESAAVRVMKRLKKRITYKTMTVLGALVVLMCFVVITINEICARKIDGYQGLFETLHTLPAENFHVAELYQLKNGDLYCTLESDKGFVITQTADWVLPQEKRTENTNEAVKELRFRRGAFWDVDSIKQKEKTVIFPLERQGTVTENEKTRTITQSCADISVYGKTQKDKMTIWEAGQKVAEAPKEIEEEAVRAYLREGLYAKAVKECENMGWEDYEKIFGDTGLSWRTEIMPSEPELTVTSECYSVLVN